MRKHSFKKILSFILCAVMLASVAVPMSVSADTVEQSATVGYSKSLIDDVDLTGATPMINLRTGTEGAYSYLSPTSNTSYTIDRLEELLIFSEVLKAHSSEIGDSYAGSFHTCTVYLTSDINCSSIENFEPLGGWSASSSVWSGAQVFRGLFDGLGHTIDYVTMDAGKSGMDESTEGHGYVSLFRCLANASNASAGIKNLIIGENCKFIASNKTGPISALVSVVETGWPVTISNVWNKSDIVSNGQIAGGLVAYSKNSSNFRMINCQNDGDITTVAGSLFKTVDSGAIGIGGMVGGLGHKNSDKTMTAMIQNCVNNGKIVSSTNGGAAGGIVGYTSSKITTFTVTIDSCVNNGTVANEYKGNSGYAGGILGIMGSENTTMTITNNVNNGKYYSISSEAERAKGLVGDSKSIDFNSDDSNDINGENISVYTRMVVNGLQGSTEPYQVEGEGQYYSLRVASMHKENISTYENYGYKISISYVEGEATVTRTLKNPLASNKVYTSILVGGMEPSTVTPDDGYAYIGAIVIENIPVTLGDITLTVTPYVEYSGVGVVEGVATSFSYSPATQYPNS